jgi:hypothetical protein
MDMRLKSIICALFATLVLAATTSAQMPDATLLISGPPAGQLQAKAGAVDMRIETMDAAPIKGAPFCATVSTEHTQHLADGNRIHTTEAAQLCRDSEGRTRRESGLNLLGAAPAAAAPKLITIVDPVAGFRYLLDTENKIAQKMSLSADKVFVSGESPDGGKGEHVVIMQRSGGQGGVFLDKTIVKKTGDDPSEARNAENLGDQTIEGIHATGTRMTTVIPAGKMGNDKAITITSERWYSPDLKVAVMTKHDDPWAGELKTEFKNVTTGEPDAALFAVPADYKIVDEKDGPIRIKLSGPAEPPQ